ncbi:MAG TPA: outer membrane protein assembly factor BamD [Candidatus Binataceae bacterium]|nr:outer membrane protein assembly factor BamD [Candidatus Binataceae bacterium]
MSRYSIFFAAAMLCVTLAACSTKKQPSAEQYYQQAQLNFTNKEYSAAIENYQFVVDKFPFSPYAEESEMKIGLAYYKNKDYAQAIAALDDFQRMHPTSKNLQLVSYYIAMSYFDQVGREDQDQSKTEMALARFQAIEQRFPESEFAELAKEKSAVCREVLARHQKVVGDYYFKRANFRAAESRLAELMQKYPDTPVAPDALWELGMALEKEGKKYSAAQAFAAMVQHYPDTMYAKRARAELKKLNQPVDNEEDPLKLVLAENGYGENIKEVGDNVEVRQRDTGPELASNNSAYGADDLPNLQAAAASAPPIAPPPRVAPTQVASAGSESTASGLPAPAAEEPKPAAEDPNGPPTLRTIRLSSSNPPMSVIFDLSKPVKYDQHIDNGPGYSSVKVLLKGVAPDPTLQTHVVFDRSIFRDCDVTTDGNGTLITVNTVPVMGYAIVPLTEPPRLLVTFTPQNSASN